MFYAIINREQRQERPLGDRWPFLFTWSVCSESKLGNELLTADRHFICYSQFALQLTCLHTRVIRRKRGPTENHKKSLTQNFGSFITNGFET